jgi:ssDNA-binding Zn-finger/Zn-ribbon topoisomerase 1
LINELIENTFNNRSPSDALEYLYDLGNRIVKEGKLTGEEILRCTERYAIQHNICPECGSDLEFHIDKQRSEAWGRSVYEEIGFSFCPSCGWKEND